MNNFVEQLALLTGQEPSFKTPDYLPKDNWEIFNSHGLGYSQLNEYLLALGYDRITRGFYNYFFCKDKRKSPEFTNKNELDLETPFRIENYTRFEQDTDHFRKYAMLKYGNIKFAFKIKI